MKSAAVPALTGVRGVAALWVLLFHMRGVCAAFGCAWFWNAPLLEAGWRGVDFFFVLSGYVLMRAHGDDFARPSGAALIAFARLRVSRIYPLHLAVLLLVVSPLALDPGFVAWRRVGDPGAFSTAALAKTAALATRWGFPGRGEWNEPVWSLSAEVLGYAAFPVAAWALLRTRRAGAAVRAGLAALALLALIQLHTQPDGYNRIDTFGALARMGFAVFAGAAFARARALAGPGAESRFRLAGEGAAVALLAVCLLGRFSWAAAPCFVLIAAALEGRSGPLVRALSSRTAVWLGRVSFPLYLLHAVPLSWLAFHARTDPGGAAWGPAVFAAYPFAALALAWLLHRTVERPSQRWGRRWAARGGGADAPAGAVGVRLRTG